MSNFTEKKWKRRRRIVDPAFSIPMLMENYLPIFNKQARNLIQDLEAKLSDEEEYFHIWSFIITRTFCTISGKMARHMYIYDY